MIKFSLCEHLYYGASTNDFFFSPNINKTNNLVFVKIARNILNLLKTETKSIMHIPPKYYINCENFDSLVHLT